MSENRTHRGVSESFAAAPIVGVVRAASAEEGTALARRFISAGLELVEITFTVPRADSLIAELVAERGDPGPPWIGAGTVTDEERASQALTRGAEFLFSPNVSASVARAAREAGTFLALGALTPTEIFAAHRLGADLVKVFPLPPVGGAAYLTTVRQPLDDIAMLAAGGFGVEEIPAYRAAGASAFGLGEQLFEDSTDDRAAVRAALALARGET